MTTDDSYSEIGLTSTPVAASPVAVVPSTPARSRLLATVVHVLAPLAACLITLYFFCPRYYLWRGIELSIPELYTSPEINRAGEVLKQLDDPYIAIDHPSNRVIYWRKLFPIVGHYLHLSRNLFLALPFLGCWAAAAAFYGVLLRAYGRHSLAFYGTVSLCASSWFFVSTGWLSYNDSWLMLGLIIVAFAEKRAYLVATCLLMPWVEERFLIMLPACIALRTFMPQEKSVSFRALVFDIATVIAGSAPYLLVRVVAYLQGNDPVLNVYLNEIFIEVPLWRYVEGTYAGLRLNWIYVALWAWLAWYYRPKWWVVIVQLGLIITLVTILKVVGDLHRSAAAFLPYALAGMVLFQRRSPAFSAKLLPIIAALNLVLPAAHVITVFKYPVFGLYDELHNSENNVNPLLSPQFYNDTALRLALANQSDDAIKLFDRALSIDPEFHTARLNKAFILTSKKKYDEALAELNICLEAKPDWPEAYYARGVCKEQKLDYKGAVTDWHRALNSEQKEWGFRAETERQYKRLRGVGINPIPKN